MSSDFKNLSAFAWSIAETLRGDFKQSEYGKVILPFVVLGDVPMNVEIGAGQRCQAHG
jgi:type I restriction-modification system DNA methylase subunit